MMSGFYVKTLRRAAIVTDDYYFLTDEKLTEFLQGKFAEDPQKYYKVIPSAIIDEKCKRRREGVPIAGCTKSRMIVWFQME